MKIKTIMSYPSPPYIKLQTFSLTYLLPALLIIAPEHFHYLTYICLFIILLSIFSSSAPPEWFMQSYSL